MGYVDMTESNINIDAMLDVYVNAQKDAGIDPGLEECELEVDKRGSIVRKKPKLDEEPVKDKPKCSSCGSCKSEKSNKPELPWYMVNRLGLFEDSMSPEIDDGDDDDETYICEYCTDIGYKKEYKPYMCDTCDVCSTCPEYENNDCSGCGYSIYRTGRLYSQELANRGEEIPLDADEKEIIDYVNNPDIVKEEIEARIPNFDFTILDYDHKY